MCNLPIHLFQITKQIRSIYANHTESDNTQEHVNYTITHQTLKMEQTNCIEIHTVSGEEKEKLKNRKKRTGTNITLFGWPFFLIKSKFAWFLCCDWLSPRHSY